MQSLTLLRRQSALSDPAEQVRLLEQDRRRPFAAALAEIGLHPLSGLALEVLQVNVGKLCNQTCRHCHVDAGPDRTEVMTRETMQHCLNAIERAAIPTLDITGGAPELNPNFRWLVEAARTRNCHVIDRCNLTILTLPRFADMPAFLSEHKVEVIASLPCYSAENTDRQRGDGVFDQSIQALRRLNELGYGHPGSELILSLVYNPGGPSLPPPQSKLETAYRQELAARFGIVFNRLFTITNMPISRFLEDLIEGDHYEAYMTKLRTAFNPTAATGVMCRTMLSVGWDGRLYDCDFNQMLDLECSSGVPRHIRDFDPTAFAQRRIITGEHCYGCTAGAGSGCQGAIRE